MKRLALLLVVAIGIFSSSLAFGNPRAMVAVSSEGEEIGRFTAPWRPYGWSGHNPAVTHFFTPQTAGRTEDGRIVVGVSVIGWEEERGARVVSYVLVPKDRERNEFTSEKEAVEPIEVDSRWIRYERPTEIQAISDFGVPAVTVEVTTQK